MHNHTSLIRTFCFLFWPVQTDDAALVRVLTGVTYKNFLRLDSKVSNMTVFGGLDLFYHNSDEGVTASYKNQWRTQMEGECVERTNTFGDPAGDSKIKILKAAILN